MLNQCNFIGNLGNDVDSRFMPNGDQVVNFSVACTERWKDKQTGEMKEQTEWVRVVAFRQLADICARFLKKGSKCYISGKMRTRSWDKDGTKVYTTEVVISDMKMLDSKPQEGAQQSGDARGRDQGQSRPQRRTGATAPPTSGQPSKDFGDFDDDIPF